MIQYRIVRTCMTSFLLASGTPASKHNCLGWSVDKEGIHRMCFSVWDRQMVPYVVLADMSEKQ